MKTIKALFALLLASFATLTPAADPPAIVGRLNYLAGPVSFAPADANTQWSAAVLNRPITSGDRLWTDSGGRAEWHVGSTAIRLAERTSLDALHVDESRVQLGLALGAINVRLREVVPDSTFEVDTPQGAIIFTEPGSYRIDVDVGGRTTVLAVRSGRADVLTSTQRFEAANGQRTTITGTDAVRFNVTSLPLPDEFDHWADARDRREDNVVSTRYLPPGMTGYEDLDGHGTWESAPDYGYIWAPTAVPADWAPYRNGHWVWISPWGWTWIDDAPWGFAPFHYGRWVWYRHRWAWAPGPPTVRPVYAPALVGFVGGARLTVGVGAPAVGWVPLGWREPFVPWYRTTPHYVQRVNVPHVHNVTTINVTEVRYVNRAAPSGMTVVPREQFVGARRVQPVPVTAATLAGAPISNTAPVGRPEPSSFTGARPGHRPPVEAFHREALATQTPPAVATRAVPPVPPADSARSVPQGQPVSDASRRQRRHDGDSDGELNPSGRPPLMATPPGQANVDRSLRGSRNAAPAPQPAHPHVAPPQPAARPAQASPPSMGAPPALPRAQVVAPPPRPEAHGGGRGDDRARVEQAQAQASQNDSRSQNANRRRAERD